MTTIDNRYLFQSGLLVVVLSSVISCTGSMAVDREKPLLLQAEHVLKENPLPKNEKAQNLRIFQDDNSTSALVRVAAGGEIKAHFHKTHNEMVIVISGSGQLFINNKWVKIKTGNILVNPLHSVHAVKNTGNNDLVVVSIFTPAMKEPDRHFVN